VYDETKSGYVQAKLFQRQLAIPCQPLANPGVMGLKLFATKVSLPTG
jgi:hypothetical protein